MLYLLVIRPVTALSRVANRVSLGEPMCRSSRRMAVTRSGPWRIVHAMRRSLDQAHQDDRFLRPIPACRRPPRRSVPAPRRNRSGGMGIIYLAHDPAIDRAVAIKSDSPPPARIGGDDMSVAARFRVEAKAAGRLTHRNIVSIDQFAEDNDFAYIVMEYVAGRNLRDYVQPPRKLEVPQVLCVMMQLLDGLHSRARARHRAPGHQAGESADCR